MIDIKNYMMIIILAGSILSAQATFPESRGKILDRDAQPIILSPIGGYLAKKEGISEGVGKKGLEKQYDIALASGTDVPTAIHTKLQQKTENILDEMKVELNATEVLAMVMDSKTGELIAIATSNRYDPTYIRVKDIPSLVPKFSAYSFEPGSVMMPFTVAMSLNANPLERHKEKQWINTDFDKFQIGNNIWIRDDVKHKTQTMTDVLVNSSNIGAVQIAWEMPASIFHYALNNYGFGQKSGIDLPRDLEGKIKDETLLESKLHRANTAYGYGMLVTPIQLLKAYSIFSNDGMMVTPHIGISEVYEAKEVLYKGNARKVKKMLTEVVNRGTGKYAYLDGLTIGGKTGTAHIAKNGKYSNDYHSSFYGFAEDNVGNSYTIGVLVIEAKNKDNYFASRSAVPTFKKIVDVMIKEKLLVIDSQESNKIVGICVSEKTISPLLGGKLVKAFGTYIDKTYNIKVFNEYITIKSSKKNQKVQNVLDGIVIFSGESNMLGNVVVMAHKDKLHTVYTGLIKISPIVTVGKLLKKGTVIGRVKNKLVFQVTQDSIHVDPLNLVEL